MNQNRGIAYVEMSALMLDEVAHQAKMRLGENPDPLVFAAYFSSMSLLTGMFMQQEALSVLSQSIMMSKVDLDKAVAATEAMRKPAT